jgi:hypothetical protein
MLKPLQPLLIVLSVAVIVTVVVVVGSSSSSFVLISRHCKLRIVSIARLLSMMG